MMSATARIVPLHRPAPHRAVAGDTDLVLRISNADGATPGIEARRVDDDAPLAAWRGDIARQLLAAPALHAIVSGNGDYPCTQGCLRRLVLAAATIEAGLERLAERRDAVLAGLEDHRAAQPGFAPEPLAHRLGHLGASLDGDERLVARVLFAYPGEHFTARDIGCLVGLTAPACRGADVGAPLRSLVERDVIQSIEIDGAPTFYDIDTRPHAHRYDPATGRLYDNR